MRGLELAEKKWLLLGGKIQRRGMPWERGEQPHPFQCPCHCPSPCSGSLSPCAVWYHLPVCFWHVCFLPIEGKLLEDKDIYLFCSLTDSPTLAHGRTSTILLNEWMSLLVCAGLCEWGFRALLCPRGEDSYPFFIDEETWGSERVILCWRSCS